MKTYEGKLVSEGVKVGIVVARFNEFITSKLLGGAIDGLKRENVKEENIEVAWVPGPSKSHLLQKRWQIVKNMTQSFALVQLSVGQHLTTIMYVQRFQRVWLRLA